MKYIKFLLFTICVVLLCALAVSCGVENSDDIVTLPEQDTTSATVTEAPQPLDINIAVRGEQTEFQVVYNMLDDAAGKYAARILNVLKNQLGVTLQLKSDYLASQETACEILVGADKRPDCNALTQTLGDDEYAIKVVSDGDKTKVIIAYKGVYALMCAVDRFLSECVDAENGTASVPADFDVRGSYTEQQALIVSSITQLRDPCILVEDGVYYAYGTGWVCYKNTSGDLRGEWQSLGVVAQKPEHADNNY